MNAYEVSDIVIRRCRSRGCTCDPDIAIRDDSYVDVWHHSDCRLGQAIVMRRAGAEGRN